MYVPERRSCQQRLCSSNRAQAAPRPIGASETSSAIMRCKRCARVGRYPLKVRISRLAYFMPSVPLPSVKKMAR